MFEILEHLQYQYYVVCQWTSALYGYTMLDLAINSHASVF